MKRVLGSLLVGIALLLAIPTNTGAAVNDFSIERFDIRYELSKDENNRSILKTVETIDAVFPTANQNHGIERFIPHRYNKHPTHLNVEGVNKSDGSQWQYETRTEGDSTVLRIGDPDTYVDGRQRYVITYVQHDVTRFYEDTNKDEWYWDTNGVGWDVPIGRLSVTIHISDSVLSALTGEPACYQGQNGENNRCAFYRTTQGEYALNVTNLERGENVTVAFGFTPGAFAPYEPTLFERIVEVWGVLVLITGALSLAGLIYLSVMYGRRQNRTAELHTVPVQYIPPKDTTVMLASQVVSVQGSVFGALLVELAVKRVIAIIEMKPAKWFSLAEYDLEMLVDGDVQPSEVKEILSDMWGHVPAKGERLSLSSLRNNMTYTARTYDNAQKMKALVEGDYALREKSQKTSKYFYTWAKWLLGLGVVTVSIPFLVLAGIVALFGYTIRPLTDKGLELRRYLLGLSTYIKASEAERLKFFQGPDTAEKVGEAVDTNNPGQIVKLYERVLPYAIIFGHEKEWTKRIGDLYEQTQTSPSWYSGSSAFNAAVFTGAMHSFSTAANYSGGASSSTGGTSGGGSSGGGGGGGGGGGW